MASRGTVRGHSEVPRRRRQRRGLGEVGGGVSTRENHVVCVCRVKREREDIHTYIDKRYIH